MHRVGRFALRRENSVDGLSGLRCLRGVGMAVELEQVDAQKHHVNRRYFSQVASGTRQYRDVSSFVEKRMKRFPGERPAKFWTGKREQARMSQHRVQA